MAWKGFGAKLRLMCQANDLFLYRCRLQACGLATPEELAAAEPPVVVAAAAAAAAAEAGGKGDDGEGEGGEGATALAPVAMETAA
jgi:hypothetical protein